MNTSYPRSNERKLCYKCVNLSARDRPARGGASRWLEGSVHKDSTSLRAHCAASPLPKGPHSSRRREMERKQK